MADISFLKIHPSKAVAQNLGDSPQAVLHYTSQIQLKPLDVQPYRQATFGTIHLPIAGDYAVYLVKAKDETEVDITANVGLGNFVENGITQLSINIYYLPTDYGNDPVYLRIDPGTVAESAAGYYSNKFLVTNIGIDLTTRVDYIDKSRNIPTTTPAQIGFIQSIRLRFYYDNAVSKAEVEKYYQITRGQNVNPRILKNELRQYKTQLFNAFTFERLTRAFYTGICYLDQIRNYPFEGLEYNKREGDSNISEMEFITDPDETDVLIIAPVVIGTLRDFLTNMSNDIRINDPNNYLVTTTQIPV